MKLTPLILSFLLIGLYRPLTCQENKATKFYNYAFDKDSLKGFDEEAAARAAVSEQFLGGEFNVRMFQLKRSYLNTKYKLVKDLAIIPASSSNAQLYKPSSVAGNMDFESSTAGAITTSNQVAGWTLGRGTHTSVTSGANSCNLLGYNGSAPQESEIFSVPNGYIDPVIGSVYPIYSVFGTSAGDPNAEVNNPQIPQGMFGDNFIRINSSTANYSIEKISKTFTVSSANTFFQFAFISVFSAGHGCCDAGAFQLQLYNATTNSFIPCPSFSASALSGACTNTATGISYLNATSGTPANPSTAYFIFNKWQINTMDLTPYVGQSIRLELVASDCTGGSHFGYVYLDTQFSSLVFNANNIAYPSSTRDYTVLACTAGNNSICAPAGFGPYSWAGPNLQPSSSGNQCITTNASSGTFTYVMTSAGSCAPLSGTIKVIPAPSLKSSTMDSLICKGSSALLFVNGLQKYIHWSTGDTTNYVLVTPTISTTYTVKTKDIYSCAATSSLLVRVQDCTSLSSHTVDNNKYLIYPNPNKGEFVLKVTGQLNAGQIRIENTLGQLVHMQQISSGETSIKTPNLSPGMYYYSLLKDGYVTYKGKLYQL